MNRRQGWIALLLVLVLLVGIGLYRLRRSAPASTPADSEEAVSEGASADTTENIRQMPRASIAGRVTDGTGKPIANASVCAFATSDRLVSAETRVPRCVATDADGRYRIEELWVASYAVSASAPSYQPAYWRNSENRGRAIDLKAGEAREKVDIVLATGGVEVRGRVKDISGGTVVGALVSVSASAMGMPDTSGPAVTQSDAQGEWRTWVAAGRIMARATAEGYADGSKDGIAPGQFIEIVLTPESVLQGRVVEAGTDTPVEGARVSASAGSMDFPSGEGQTALTDAEGRFRISRLEPGRYKPEAKSPHRWGIANESVLLGLGETSDELRIEVHPAVSVSGRVANDDGQGCSEGFVSLTESTTNESHRTKTDGEGRARLEGLLPGQYKVDVSCRDAATEEYDPVAVSEKDVEGIVWKVTSGLRVSGIVVDAKGEAVASASVYARARMGNDPRRRGAWGTAQTERDGAFHLRGLARGTYEIEVRREGVAALKDPVEVNVERDVDGLRVVLPAGGTIEGTVVDSAGAPVAATSVQARGNRFAWNQTSTRDDGTFVLKGLNPGDYRVFAAHNWSPIRAPGTKDDDVQGVRVAVRAGETARVKVVVESQRGEIRGRVVDDGGQPVTDAFIDAERESESATNAPGQAARSMRWQWGRGTPTLADLDGQFTLSRLSPGTYTVRAYRKGGGEATVEKVRLGSSITVTIRSGGSIAGTVVASKGRAPDRFDITVRDAKSGYARQETFFRTEGAFTVRDLPAGEFQVTAEAREGRALSPVTLTQGEKRKGLRLSLEESVVVRGRIVALDNGQPVPGVHVSLRPAKGLSGGIAMRDDGGKNITDAEGRFEIERAPTGRGTLMAMPRDYRTTEYAPVFAPVTIDAGRTNELAPVRIPRRRTKGLEVPGDLGFGTQPMSPEADLEQTRYVVSMVRPGGAAAKAGLAVGDEIVSVDGQDVTGANGYLYRALSSVGEGTSISLGLRSGGSITLRAEKPL